MSGQSRSADCQRSPPAARDEYMIQPLQEQDPAIYEALLFEVVSKDDVYTSTSKRTGVLYWSVFLTSEQVTQLQHPSVIVTKLDSEYSRVDHAEWDPFGDNLEETQTGEAAGPGLLLKDLQGV